MNHPSSLFKGLFGIPLDAHTNQAQIMVGAPPQVVLGLVDPGFLAMNQAEEPQAPVAQPGKPPTLVVYFRRFPLRLLCLWVYFQLPRSRPFPLATKAISSHPPNNLNEIDIIATYLPWHLCLEFESSFLHFHRLAWLVAKNS
ncbi:hypothetical protein FRC08_005687 [Ceratobasidium sp. 394]|nr:hypothetical protein FRC08_005687 [Ceratobasidium sp. 394]